MNDDTGKYNLLNDLWGDAAPQSFRAGMLARLLREAELRRQRRRRNHRWLIVACALIAIAMVARFFPRSMHVTPTGMDLLVVHSAPLNHSMLVDTQAGTVGIIHSLSSSIAVVETLPAEKLFEYIGDEKLLALLADRPAALIRRGPFDSELVFVNPADGSGFQIH